MLTPLDHPCLGDPDVQPRHRDKIRIGMKSAQAMLDEPNPPAWIILLNEWTLWWHRQTRVVVSEDATIDFEFEGIDTASSRITSLLTDDQFAELSAILSDCARETIHDIEIEVIDGVPCALAVINGQQDWCRFAEFNLCGMSDDNLQKKGPVIVSCLRAIADSIQDQPSKAP